MDILIVGNGFDLSHFLPTKYDHFMEAMKSIEGFQGSSGMEFDDIYKILYVKEAYFFNKTKELYKYDLIKLDKDQVQTFKEMLQQNIWYKFFLMHVNDVKTWIDFEQKIEEALTYITMTIKNIEDRHLTSKSFNGAIFTTPTTNQEHYFFTELQFNILTCLNLVEKQKSPPNVRYETGLLNKLYFKSQNFEFYGFDSHRFLYFLQSELDKFIDIFNLYLSLIIDKLIPISNFEVNEMKDIKKIFSFNYTNTFNKFYNKWAPVEFLHGKLGDDQNIVLGISEINNEYLKKLKAYTFTKYHQKTLKDTDFHFFNNEIRENKYNLLKLEEAKLQHRASISTYPLSEKKATEVTNIENLLRKTNLNIKIWGHSLDISDEVYIKEIFSFNEEIDNNVRVTIYYYNKQAKSDLLTNLFHILGKDKVERWLKNNWLIFKQNPSIE